VTPIGVDDAGHSGAHVLRIVPPGHVPPAFGAGGQAGEHVAGDAAGNFIHAIRSIPCDV
jgi:hypothetical protein